MIFYGEGKRGFFIGRGGVGSGNFFDKGWRGGFFIVVDVDYRVYINSDNEESCWN